VTSSLAAPVTGLTFGRSAKAAMAIPSRV